MATFTKAVEAIQSIPALGFLIVQTEHLQEMTGQPKQEHTTEDMLQEEERDEEEHEEQTSEENVQPGKPTIQQLTELLTIMAHISNQLVESDKRHGPHIFRPALDKMMGIYKDLYLHRVKSCQQTIITRYLHKPLPINALANITVEITVEDKCP